MSNTPRTTSFYIGKARTLPDGKGVAIETPTFQECREHAETLERENVELKATLTDIATMPEYDQDDHIRLRYKAEIALSKLSMRERQYNQTTKP